MAKNKKNKDIIVLEDIELKPQVIGYTFKKKSNIGRVIVIFIIFLLAIYFINDISLFINNLIGKNTSEPIKNLANSNNNNNNKNDNESIRNEMVFHIFNNELSFKENDLLLDNFNISNNSLNFDVTNKSSKEINYSDRKYFIELYNENKTLLERIKIDFNTFKSDAKITYNFLISNDFYYFVLEEKTINDYPKVSLKNDELGNGTITCLKDSETIIYSFNNNELYEINHTLSNNDIYNSNYYVDYNTYQKKATTYNNMAGINANFNGTLNGYTLVIDIDLINADITSLSEKYYYNFKTEAKVINFEIESYGFKCE